MNIMITGLCHICVRGLVAKLSHFDLYLISPDFPFDIVQVCLSELNYPTVSSTLIILRVHPCPMGTFLVFMSKA